MRKGLRKNIEVRRQYNGPAQEPGERQRAEELLAELVARAYLADHRPAPAGAAPTSEEEGYDT